jgi:nucleoside diphosphate kinase
MYVCMSHSLRAQFGTDKTRNATHGSDSVESAARELDLVFNYIFVGVQTT